MILKSPFRRVIIKNILLLLLLLLLSLLLISIQKTHGLLRSFLLNKQSKAMTPLTLGPAL